MSGPPGAFAPDGAQSGAQISDSESPDLAAELAAPAAAPAPSRTAPGRRKGAVATNRGKQHDWRLRQLVWDLWERSMDDPEIEECSNDPSGLLSRDALPLLKLICQSAKVPGSNTGAKVDYCRRWISKKLADPGLDFSRNRSG